MKKVIFSLLVVVLLTGIFYYFYHKNQQALETNKIVYNPITEKWEKLVKADPLGEDRAEIAKNLNNSDGIHNPTVLKGYFENYDEASQTLTLKSVIPFTQDGLFETIELKLLPTQTIYCAPSIYTDPNTGQNYPIDKLVIPVKDGDTLWIPTEKVISFDDEFLKKSNERTFLYLQLTENYNQQSTNYIKKLIVIGLCE